MNMSEPELAKMLFRDTGIPELVAERIAKWFFEHFEIKEE